MRSAGSRQARAADLGRSLYAIVLGSDAFLRQRSRRQHESVDDNSGRRAQTRAGAIPRWQVDAVSRAECGNVTSRMRW